MSRDEYLKRRDQLLMQDERIAELEAKIEALEAELAELREEMTTRRKHAVTQIEVNDRILLKLSELREAASRVVFECEADLWSCLPSEEACKELAALLEAKPLQE